MIAFMRQVGPELETRGSTQVTRVATEPRLAVKQYGRLVEALEELAVHVESLPTVSADSVGILIQGTAVLLPEVAIAARANTTSEPAGIDSVIEILGRHRPVQSIVEPGTLDGGDVLRIGWTLYVAESERTNEDGIGQLGEIVLPFGYEVRVIALRESVRLKAACGFVPPHFLVANPRWIDPADFGRLVVIPVDEKEPYAANTLTIGRTTLISASCPKTEKRLHEAGIATRRVDISEFEKMGAGLSCLCLLLETRTATHTPTEIGLKPVQANGVPSVNGHSSQAVVHGGLVYTSLLVPFDLSEARFRRASIEEQTEQVIRNLSLVLTASGSSLGQVLRTTLHVADPRHAPRADAVCAKMFGKHRPARAVVANGALPPGVLVEVEAVAALGD